MVPHVFNFEVHSEIALGIIEKIIGLFLGNYFVLIAVNYQKRKRNILDFFVVIKTVFYYIGN